MQAFGAKLILPPFHPAEYRLPVPSGWVAPVFCGRCGCGLLCLLSTSLTEVVLKRATYRTYPYGGPLQNACITAAERLHIADFREVERVRSLVRIELWRW